MTLHERIREMLEYNPNTGEFRWRKNVGNVKQGSVAGCKASASKCYIKIGVGGRRYLAHRLAWFWMTGKWPPEQIDHRNTKKDDNRWCNLRLASNAENHLNRGKNKNNITGYKGVSICAKSNKYSANLHTKQFGKLFLGYYSTAQEAHEAYKKALAQINPVFGRAV